MNIKDMHCINLWCKVEEPHKHGTACTTECATCNGK